MGKYFGREPRYSQEEAEAQARQAIDAAVSKGRPPAEDWKGLAGRMGDINRELATRPPVEIPPPPPRRAPGEARRPRVVSDILRPRPEPEPEPGPTPPPAKRAPVKRVAKAAAPEPAKRAPRKAAPAPAKAKRPAPKKRPG